MGRPGMVMISPVRATMKPAPAETFRLRTVTVEAAGRAQQGLVVGEGVLGLGHADGQVAEAQVGELLGLLLGVGGEHHPLAVIHLLHNGVQLLLDGGLGIIRRTGSGWAARTGG